MISIERPVVGITTFKQQEEESEVCFGKIGCNYIKSIYQAGGLPVPIPMIENRKETTEYLKLIDGLILSGGQDICPTCYQEEPDDNLIAVDLNRDKWELKLFKEAYSTDMPVLGICRGMQLINVGLGGTLYQDLTNKSHMSEERFYNYHTVEIIQKSNLSEILSDFTNLKVNSRHHQAVKDLGDNLRVAARDESGIVETIEAKNKNFVIGVQWHPEDLISDRPCFKKLFTALIEKAQKTKVTI